MVLPPFLKTARSLERSAIEILGRTPSSWSTTTSCISPSASFTYVMTGSHFSGKFVAARKELFIGWHDRVPCF